MDKMSKKKRSKVMRSIKSSDTSIELKVRGVLPAGFVPQYKFACNADFAYVREKVAVFVDGNFWHGKDFDKKKHKYNKHWQDHIQGNIDRDRRNRKMLERAGWVVLSYWEDEVNDDLGRVADDIADVVRFRRDNPPSDYQDSFF